MLLVIALWGVNWPIMKIAINGTGAAAFTAMRMATAAGVMFAIVAAMGRLRWPERGDLPVIAHIGILQMGVYLVLVGKGLEVVGAGRAAVLAYTTPIWVAPLSMIVLKERLGLRALFGVCAALLGVGVLFNPLELDWHEPRLVGGNLLLLLAALIWSLGIVHVRGHRWRASPIEAAPWQFALAAVVACLDLAWAGPPPVLRLDALVIAAIAFNGFGSTTIGFLLWTMLTRILPSMTTATASLGIPVVGVIASALALGEPVTIAMVAGGALIVVSLLLSFGGGARTQDDEGGVASRSSSV